MGRSSEILTEIYSSDYDDGVIYFLALKHFYSYYNYLKQSLSLEPNPEVLTKVLALVSDHVDLLLEDWYPSLGELTMGHDQALSTKLLSVLKMLFV